MVLKKASSKLRGGTDICGVQDSSLDFDFLQVLLTHIPVDFYESKIKVKLMDSLRATNSQTDV